MINSAPGLRFSSLSRPGRVVRAGSGDAISASRATPIRRRTISAPDPVRPAKGRERVLLATMLNHPELFEEFGEALGEVQFTGPAARPAAAGGCIGAQWNIPALTLPHWVAT